MAAGISIQRPVPLIRSTVATLPPPAPSPSLHPPRVVDPYSSLPQYYQNLQDLVELEEAGEAVIYPSGLNRVTALASINEILQSGNVERLHSPSSGVLADNSIITQEAPSLHSASAPSSGPVIPEALSALDDPDLFFEED